MIIKPEERKHNLNKLRHDILLQMEYEEFLDEDQMDILGLKLEDVELELAEFTT